MSGALFFERLRRTAAERGVTGASATPRAVEGRPEDFRLSRSRLVEDAELSTRPVGLPLPCPEPMAFVDGTQRYEIVGYVGTQPIVAAIVSAAVRLREGGHFRTIERGERCLLIGRADALDGFGARPNGLDPLELEGGEALHPLKALEDARRAIDTARGVMERDLGARFRESHDAWLVVDGVISDSPVWANDPRAIGVSKSHATLPFDGDDLLTYLTLDAGERTSVFEPTTWRFLPAHSWGLRLWDYRGKDLLHGLVRVEMAAGQCPTAVADRVSRWLLAERVPLSRPDPRWDRLLYGVATVERHLRAR